jgi:hypothetical protein
MNPNRCLIPIAAVAATVVGGSLAIADKKTFQDPKDAKGPADIKEVRAGHDPKGRLVHRIEMYGNIPEGRAPGVNVYAGEFDRVGSSYQVSSFGVTNGLGEKTGRVKTKTPDNKTVIYKFRKGAIDNPDSYKWQACVCIEGEQQDLAPDKKATHKLR